MMERKRAFMADDVWDKLLHEYIVPYKNVNCFSPPTFIPHKDGEPLLNKNLPSRLLDLAAVAPDMKVDIYSHGLMLPKWINRGQDFVEFLGTLPNKVRYMMSYHPRNHDDSVNDYSETVKYLSHILIAPPPNVEFITVSHKSRWVTPEMQESWRLTWAGLPITVHSNCSINPWTGLIEDQATCHFNGCPYADFGHWFIGVTGNIIACCMDLEEEIVLGNMLTDNAPDMFDKTSKFYARQRQILTNKEKVDHQVCANCYGQKRDPVPSELVPLGVRIA